MPFPVRARSALPAAALAIAVLPTAQAVAASGSTRGQASRGPAAPPSSRRSDSWASFQRTLGLKSAFDGGARSPDARPAETRVSHAIRLMVAAGSRIARRPYVWGGGHGSFNSTGYDCSGSVSYVLHAAGMLSTPADSGGLTSYGDPGPGRHVTIYANSGHVLMSIDGRRFDTIALQETGTRWSSQLGSVAGYVVRHPHGM
jgi:cell wall-associated NlpC family hydrolase